MFASIKGKGWVFEPLGSESTPSPGFGLEFMSAKVIYCVIIFPSVGNVATGFGTFAVSIPTSMQDA